ncbi:MAG TPA: hypothetical protein VK361_08450 [Rubrobacteraceae bacterium]|nr:hypothetical protein [Rubrobacteraceae bacterium]
MEGGYDFRAILTCRYPLEAHLSGVVVTQQGPKGQPARAIIGAVLRN